MGKKKMYFFFSANPIQNATAKKKKTAHLVLGQGGFGEAQEAQSGLGEGQPWWGEPWGCPWGGSAALGLCTGKRQPAQQAAGAAAGSPAPCLPRNSSAKGENDKEEKFSCLCAPRSFSRAPALLAEGRRRAPCKQRCTKEYLEPRKYMLREEEKGFEFQL